MQGSNADLILSYFVTGQDPVPTVDLSQNATIIIPNGNSAIASQGFYMPLNLEVMRGTTVTWHNEDNIDHYLQAKMGTAISPPCLTAGFCIRETRSATSSQNREHIIIFVPYIRGEQA